MNTTKKFWYLLLPSYNEHMTGSKIQKVEWNFFFLKKKKKREKKKKELR